MHLSNLGLFNFKNYETANFKFEVGLNCILGRNASGKTNILDAIHFLALTKSAFNNSDPDCIKYNQNSFLIKGTISHNSSIEDIYCSVELGKKKVLKFKNKEYAKLSDHIGKVPLVFINPDDVDIIRGGSEERRRFFDNCLSQIENSYLENLLSYKKVVRQRNSLLKRSEMYNSKIDETLLSVYDDQLIPINLSLSKRREEFLTDFNETFNKYYNRISGEAEEITILYDSKVLKENFQSTYIRSRKLDIQAQRTLMGIHRDEYKILFKNSGKRVKDYGSQGQKKSVIIALKLAQGNILKKNLNINPILLLDDIFDRLDENRIGHLLKLVLAEFSQTIITDAKSARTKDFLGQLGITETNFIIIDNDGIE